MSDTYLEIDRSPLSVFQEKVAIKYQLFNGLFLTLPFEDMDQVGTELPVFSQYVKDRLDQKINPKTIIEKYFREQRKTDDFKEISRILFRFLQFVERQVVLFDALEDAAFEDIHKSNAEGTLFHLLVMVRDCNKEEELAELLKDYTVRIVLTAHPTQFYPSSVLGIITDLTQAIKDNNLSEINDLLLQMGKTRFTNKTKPTPEEEATTLIWFLENIFYEVIPSIHTNLFAFLSTKKEILQKKTLIELGFWPGGDRDGNPYVTHKTTLHVAQTLRSSILLLYKKDLSSLKKRLTFDGVFEELNEITQKILRTYEASVSDKGHGRGIYFKVEEFIADLKSVREKLVNRHSSLFLNKLDHLIHKVLCFGFHFASLDLRQDSRVHSQVMLEAFRRYPALSEKLPSSAKKGLEKFDTLNDNEKLGLLTELVQTDYALLEFDTIDKQDIVEETLLSILTVKTIQKRNGEKALCRYIISNTQRSADILVVMLLAKWVGLHGTRLKIDIIPLFETVEDLKNADHIMDELYKHKIYREHIRRRGMEQTVMLGFSDGTKDGGPLAANWSIYTAKQRLTQTSRGAGIRIHFFDGRGGPPARGGENTHKYYKAQGRSIEQKQIQLTIQGQTISSKFGTYTAARYNLENLFTASLGEKLFPTSPTENKSAALNEEKLMDELSKHSLNAYLNFKNHELFIPYLEERTPLRFFSMLKIGSRPIRRKSGKKLRFEDLRAISFVSSWSQMKQNIPGYYGLGSAIEQLENAGHLESVKLLYKRSLFFRTLVENAMQSLSKSNMKLTQYLERDKRFGSFWQIIQKEAHRTASKLKEITEQKELMDTDPQIRASIKIREQVVFPLLVIQQYALTRLYEGEDQLKPSEKVILQKMVIKSLAANINASRNSA